MKKFICILGLFLCACAPKAETPVGKNFVLIQAAQPMPITLTLDADGRFYGKAVNNYFGVYQINENQIQMDLQGQTMMMGPIPQMQAEDDFFKSLREIKSFDFKNNQLILNADKPYIFEISDTN